MFNTEVNIYYTDTKSKNNLIKFLEFHLQHTDHIIDDMEGHLYVIILPKTYAENFLLIHLIFSHLQRELNSKHIRGYDIGSDGERGILYHREAGRRNIPRKNTARRRKSRRRKSRKRKSRKRKSRRRKSQKN